jgi:hypothetical protein
VPKGYGKLAGLLQARDAAGKLSKPVRRIGMRSIETTLMTRFGALTLTLDAQGYFRLVAQSRGGDELVVQEGNLHAMLDAGGLMDADALAALLSEEDVKQ